MFKRTVDSWIQRLKEGITPSMIFFIILGSAICTFGVHNIHQQTHITEGGLIGTMLLIERWLGLPPSVITPTDKNTPEAIQWAKELAQVLGFKHICTLTVQEHDKMIGYVSQLCHAIAVSLMCANDNTSLCEYTGDSFRDLTRIARINDKMWAELFLWNKENLISEIDQFDAALCEMRNALVADDRDKLEEMFRLSTQRRAAFDKKLP